MCCKFCCVNLCLFLLIFKDTEKLPFFSGSFSFMPFSCDFQLFFEKITEISYDLRHSQFL